VFQVLVEQLSIERQGTIVFLALYLKQIRKVGDSRLFPSPFYKPTFYKPTCVY